MESEVRVLNSSDALISSAVCNVMTAVLFVLNSLSYMSYILHGLFSIAKVGRWVCTRLGARQTSALSGCNKADRSPKHSEKTLGLVVNRVRTYMALA